VLRIQNGISVRFMFLEGISSPAGLPGTIVGLVCIAVGRNCKNGCPKLCNVLYQKFAAATYRFIVDGSAPFFGRRKPCEQDTPQIPRATTVLLLVL
jgi:hypothetical protein